jgi:hypothetical protein
MGLKIVHWRGILAVHLQFLHEPVDNVQQNVDRYSVPLARDQPIASASDTMMHTAQTPTRM